MHSGTFLALEDASDSLRAKTCAFKVKGSRRALVSKSGVGKSLPAEQLAVCFVYGRSFPGMKIEPHSVPLIDQDTTTEDLEKRLRAFGSYMRDKGFSQKHKLYTESQSAYSLSDGSLVSRIRRSKSKVVIVDSLGSVCRDLDVNRTKDARVNLERSDLLMS